MVSTENPLRPGGCEEGESQGTEDQIPSSKKAVPRGGSSCNDKLARDRSDTGSYGDGLSISVNLLIRASSVQIRMWPRIYISLFTKVSLGIKGKSSRSDARGRDLSDERGAPFPTSAGYATGDQREVDRSCR